MSDPAPIEDDQLERQYCVDCGSSYYPGGLDPACSCCSTAYEKLGNLQVKFEEALKIMEWLKDCATCWCDQLEHSTCGICDAAAFLDKEKS